MNLIIPGLILWAAGSAIGIGLANYFNWTVSSLPVIGGFFPMAVDTRDERMSINLLMPWRTQLPLPDAGAIDQADRQMQAWSYPGILAAGAVTRRLTPPAVLAGLPWGPL